MKLHEVHFEILVVKLELVVLNLQLSRLDELVRLGRIYECHKSYRASITQRVYFIAIEFQCMFSLRLSEAHRSTQVISVCG